MADKFLTRILLLIIMIAIPFSLFAFAYPSLSTQDFSNYPYIPSLLAVTFVILAIGDVFGIIWLVIKWIRDDF